MIVLFICALLCSNAVGKNEDYMGYKIYNIKLKNETNQDIFHMLTSEGIEFLKKPCIKYNTIGKAMVPPSHFDWFENKLAEMEIDKDVAINDVYDYLKQKESGTVINNINKQSTFNFDAFHRYNVILDYLYTLQDTYVSSTISFEVINYGITQENCPLVYIKLTNGNDENKPVVVIEAGIIPREWITIPAALNIVNKLLEEDQRQLLDEKTWIIVPVLNPDGYEYTHTNLRFWSKSRSVNSHLGFICPGVNLNRNFDIDWQISDSSSSPCSHLYAGVEPFSEIETSYIRNLIFDFHPLVYISLQNNGNFITFPWRYEKAASGLFIRHFLLGLDMIKDLEGYNLDSGALAFGDRESGTSVDFARWSRVHYTYNIGVEGEGDDGVIVAESNIKIKADNVWKAVEAAVRGIEVN